jgi:flavin reductase (DIM6/NTAB) family NADH-FMN oxidoreductase RutF
VPIERSPYALLRHLTLPVVAVTTSAEGRRNGMIANSAQRASLVPFIPRISIYISKTNYTHELVYRSGVLGIHLLRQDQWELIWQLGLQSGRDRDKLRGIALHPGETGCPLIVDVCTAFECRVINAMDAGASTFFLGDVTSVREGTPGPVMTSEYFRQHMPEAWRQVYEARLAEAQELLEPLARRVERKIWEGPVVSP